VLCCSTVSDVGFVVIAFEAVGCCICMGDVWIASILLFRGGGVVPNGLTI